jgi:hypothetical protein
LERIETAKTNQYKNGKKMRRPFDLKNGTSRPKRQW